MKVQVTKNELTRMFAEKYDENVELVIVNEDGEEVVEEVVEVVEVVEEVDFTEDDEEFAVDREFTAEDLVRITAMDKILEKALRDQNYESKIPDDPTAVCVEAAEEFIEGLSRKERRIMVGVVNQTGFKKFAILWQEFQNSVHKKL